MNHPPQTSVHSVLSHSFSLLRITCSPPYLYPHHHAQSQRLSPRLFSSYHLLQWRQTSPSMQVCYFIFKQIYMRGNSWRFTGSVDGTERARLMQQKGVTVWFTGLSASGKVLDLQLVSLAPSNTKPVTSPPSPARSSSIFYT